MKDPVSMKVRQLVAKYGQLPVDVASLGERSDLYAAGLKSLATVQLMLALEGEFGIELPEHRLNRRTFASLATIESCVRELLPKEVEA